MYTTQQQQIREKVRAYLQENFLYTMPDVVLDDDDKLLERGIVDSMGIVELLTFIEDEFGVQPADEEISEANLGTVRAVVSFITSKQAGVPA
ncbi:MAG TPA: acyl carrier protein [Gemmatimonadaceae bacterium]|nr:acyl carrier protein [Gemmatimonadaceae bacterium]